MLYIHLAAVFSIFCICCDMSANWRSFSFNSASASRSFWSSARTDADADLEPGTEKGIYAAMLTAGPIWVSTGTTVPWCTIKVHICSQNGHEIFNPPSEVIATVSNPLHSIQMATWRMVQHAQTSLSKVLQGYLLSCWVGAYNHLQQLLEASD